MTRPVPMYFISVWLLFWLVGVPLHNLPILESLLGHYAALLVVAVAIAAALVINIKFLQCERIYVEFALGIVSLQFGYLLTRFLWLTLLTNAPVAYPVQYLLTLGLNLFFVVYLMLPASLNKIAMCRAAILARQQHKHTNKPSEN